jgi:hypothetical protein
VKAVGDDADGPRRVAQRELRGGDRQVQNEDANENPEDRGVTIQKLRTQNLELRMSNSEIFLVLSS